MKTKVYLHSLGCAKNTVNSEQMLALLKHAGMEITSSPLDADAAVVNTCGFIDAAKEEAISVILELARLKEEGALKGLVVAGCLTQRYREEFLTELPEVDAILGTGSYTDVVAAVRSALGDGEKAFFAPREQAALEGERVLLTPPYWAWLRIAEGCDNRCAYCVIPDIRGGFRSREMEEIVAEAEGLAAGGAKELMIIAQDTTRYGIDRYRELMLPRLLDRLCEIEGLRWIRLHYLYPDEITDRLLETIAGQEKILKYFDLPIQHINDRVLKDMNRRGDGALIRGLMKKIRAMMPQSVIRTSLITGFPGETEAEHRELVDFLTEYRLERVGVFCYSQEEGSVAANRADQIDESVKELRRQEIYRLQEGIMQAHSQGLVGKVLEVLCCGWDEEREMLWGRSAMDSPEIDGGVWFTGEAKEGSFVRVKIESADGCDLFGTIVDYS